ncbi:MAG: hypothetical protein ACKOL0_07805 [Solirubrobacterales bacterium]
MLQFPLAPIFFLFLGLEDPFPRPGEEGEAGAGPPLLGLILDTRLISR